jgi:hypothetical protein
MIFRPDFRPSILASHLGILASHLGPDSGPDFRPQVARSGWDLVHGRGPGRPRVPTRFWADFWATISRKFPVFDPNFGRFLDPRHLDDPAQASRYDNFV